MVEKEVDALVVEHWDKRYIALDDELERRIRSRNESEMLSSFGLLLSGFGGGVDARKYLSRKVGQNA